MHCQKEVPNGTRIANTIHTPDTHNMKGMKIEIGNRPREVENRLRAMPPLLTYSTFFDPHSGHIGFGFIVHLGYVRSHIGDRAGIESHPRS